MYRYKNPCYIFRKNVLAGAEVLQIAPGFRPNVMIRGKKSAWIVW